MTALLAAASLFFTTPAPLDMPRAEAYLVREASGAQRLEDRYRTDDLWLAATVTGAWEDDDGRLFTLCELKTLPPPLRDGATRTRCDYAAGVQAVDIRDKAQLRQILERLSPVEVPEELERPHQLPRTCGEVLYAQGTNRLAIVCAFRPVKAPHRLLAVWELAPGDDYDECLETFEHEFLSERAWEAVTDLVAPAKRPATASARRRARENAPTERERLAADVRHNVAAYPAWHATDSGDVLVVDDLTDGGRFVSSFTNEVPALRARFAAALPGPLDGSNALAVVRLYRDRADYLMAAGEDMAWSAAYWSQARRELVACLPASGDGAELLRTLRHESLHQYLSYAAAMIPSSPWFNEGYAQYFEDENADDPGFGFVPSHEQWDAFGDALPALLRMDYAAFYAGTDEARRFRYRLAWTVARFIEKGAPEVRQKPFANLKRDYLAALVRTQDMHKATAAAFGNADTLRLFVSEWKKYWKDR